ncbi:lethal(2)neighbour of tid protein 2 [Episyrphus balteatus]|uniref:lethal(2)neighbour of tid protein 2 n=1 Tax=Episyrphus balteatus TaxID=286459 RepID=UPI0024861D83|nr:lethal(2)neighbour of tid protein 2 [Episyrphus balteatus]
MAPKPGSTRPLLRKQNQINKYSISYLYKKYVNINFLNYLVFDPRAMPIVGILILLGELIVNILVIHNVPYTEIDWIAYMQECEGFLNGTTNYALLKGDTGPLVYPAGFVYIYSFLYYITSHGANIRLAQYIFAFIYLLQIFLVIRLYSKSSKVPPYVLVLSVFTSYRIHSIYTLRLFNDPIAMLFLYLAINLFLDQRWTYGSICLSLGVSVKMNVLLFAPAILILYITNLGYLRTLQQLIVCASIQLILGAPFLFSYPWAYIKGSFDLGRVFEHKWTVNYSFLSRSIFENKIFHLSLLALHLGLLIVFASVTFNFFRSYCRLRELQKQLEPQVKRKNLEAKMMKAKKPQPKKESTEEFTPDQQSFIDSFEKSLKKSSGQSKPNKLPEDEQEDQIDAEPEKYSIQFDKCTQLAILPLFLCNFIGVICARSLHYQFYVWYFHSLPYLVWCTSFNLGTRYLILGLIEFCWNTYPSTNFSSAMLHFCHFVLLIGVARNVFQTKVVSEKLNKTQ